MHNTYKPSTCKSGGEHGHHVLHTSWSSTGAILQNREWHWAPQGPYPMAPHPIGNLKGLNNLKFDTTDNTVFVGLSFLAF